MANYKDTITKAFDQAHLYDQYARVQKISAQKLVTNIKKNFNKKFPPQTILEIGCGTGFLTQHLLRAFPEARIVASDISPKMLKRAQEKFGDAHTRLSYRVLDGETIQTNDRYDLICSNFTFQWFQNLEKGLVNCVSLLNPNGCLVFSTLTRSSFLEWQEIFIRNNVNNLFSHYPSFEALQAIYINGSSSQWKRETLIDLTMDGLNFFKELKRIGAGTLHDHSSPVKVGSLKHVIKEFNKEYQYTTYEIAIGLFKHFPCKGFFVTGTDTEVGKTFAASCLVKALKAVYWKPIQTGLNCDHGDSITVKQLTRCSDTQIIPPCIELAAPLSPEEAAKQDSQTIDIHTVQFPNYGSDSPIIIEGAGGILVPLSFNYYMIDLMKKFNLPVILVSRTSLGTINHTLMSLKILRQNGLQIAGVILNGTLDPSNKKAIESHGHINIIAEFEHFDTITPTIIDRCAKKLASEWVNQLMA